MTFTRIQTCVAETGLGVVGAFHPQAEDGAPDGVETLVLLGPSGPQMWQAFRSGAEHSDGEPHPLDRWSSRVIGALARDLGAQPLFPFGGPPWQPFQKWAVRGEGAVGSPVSMQATLGRGLWTSYRGALGFSNKIDLPETSNASPCVGCEAPCLTACPVDAFVEGAYDVPTCTHHLRSDADLPCRTGCLVRKACPYGAAIELPAEQRTFHIDAFLRANG